MLTPACSASVRRSSRWRSQRSTSTTWVCTVAARWPGRVPGRRRWRAIQPVTAFNTGADTSSLARSDTAGSRGRGDRSLARRSSPREPAPCSATLPAARHDAYPAIEWREKTSVETQTGNEHLARLHLHRRPAYPVVEGESAGPDEQDVTAVPGIRAGPSRPDHARLV